MLRPVRLKTDIMHSHSYSQEKQQEVAAMWAWGMYVMVCVTEIGTYVYLCTHVCIPVSMYPRTRCYCEHVCNSVCLYTRLVWECIQACYSYISVCEDANNYAHGLVHSWQSPTMFSYTYQYVFKHIIDRCEPKHTQSTSGHVSNELNHTHRR